MDNEKDRGIARSKLLYFLLAALGIILLVVLFIVREKNRRSVIGNIFIDPQENLLSTNGMTNIAIMGVGGAGHEAPDLTDSMMLASINYNTGDITILPIPRDIWIPSLRAKVNTAYYYGNQKREDGGIDLAKSALSELTGQPVHYAIIIEFEGFIEAIDSVGGVEVNVERSFDDYEYPIPGMEDAEPESDRYEHLHFDEGLQTMDGETALKFARSRKAEGEEGTDFARSRRQELIINAFLKKVFSSERFLKLDEAKSMVEKISSSTNTDIKVEEYPSFLKIALDFKNNNKELKTGSLTDLYENPRDREPYDGQWVLVPIYSQDDVHAYVKELFNN